MTELQIALSKPARRSVEADFAQNLPRLHGGCKQLSKELICLDRAVSFGAGENNVGIQGDHYRRPICGRISVRQAAADRALVAYLNIAQVASRFRQQRTHAPEQAR